MIKALSSLGVQVVLVIAIVVLFSFIDPFGIFAPRKKTLQNTPITVVSIKDIGQLVTAEYYGEVMSSLQETYIEEFNQQQTATNTEVKSINERYLAALRTLRTNRDSIRVRWLRRKKDLTDYFYDANPAIVNEPRYQDMLAEVLKKTAKSSEGDLLLAVWSDEKEYGTILTKATLTDVEFTAIHNAKLEELTDNRKFRKKQIIVIGRGSVKAGLDFGEFTEKNFRYDEDKDIIYLFGIAPKILDCDINPWFIPEKKVKGFEIVAATNKANDPKHLLKVKEDCLKKLEAQARLSGILEHARINAEQSLRDFFSLLLIEPVKEVRILENYFNIYRDQFPRDSLVSKEKLMLIDSALLTINSLSRDSAYQFAHRLGSLQWQFDTVENIHRYSHDALVIAEDGLFSEGDRKKFSAVMASKKFSLLDSIWFYDKGEYDSLYARERIAYMKARDFTPAKMWWDSVRQSQAFEGYTAQLQPSLTAQIQQLMTTKRDVARKRFEAFIVRNVSTIRNPDGTYVARDSTQADSVWRAVIQATISN